ncbi:TRAP-type C4-dicarboxylate transport system permease small subunit [Saccharomonospora amisosensis]|uniref:TRAP-type C4-dicarboxylate transport system permease small subunit n=1 Tax=Saccharomonospora amisosensis TaxID=1128677 RepID=A0A7X5ZR81_9PSEU|nr:TRAP transporter small permease [Saccharomonospora amisosensis]NIJ12609.1 TRAP-type C4-dicarboxylate transport system permease small subunit [Saccharomonospora amisosensis]
MRLLKYLLSFRWANALSEVAGYLSGLALVMATVAMVHGVLSRYLFGQPTVWQTEVSIYLLIFVTFVGAAYGLKHHAHVGVDLLVGRLRVRNRLVVRIVTSLLVLLVVVAVIWTSFDTWWEAVEGDYRSPTALRAPLSVVYAILPLGMLLVAFQLMAFIVDGLRTLLSSRSETEHAALLGQGNAELASAIEVASSDMDTAVDAAGTAATPPAEPLPADERHGRS